MNTKTATPKTAELEAFISQQAGRLIHQLHGAGFVRLSASQANTVQNMIEAHMLRVATETMKHESAHVLAVVENHFAGKDGQ